MYYSHVITWCGEEIMISVFLVMCSSHPCVHRCKSPHDAQRCVNKPCDGFPLELTYSLKGLRNGTAYSHLSQGVFVNIEKMYKHAGKSETQYYYTRLMQRDRLYMGNPHYTSTQRAADHWQR